MQPQEHRINHAHDRVAGSAQRACIPRSLRYADQRPQHEAAGVRIGLAVARGLALSLDLPGSGVSTLAALAAGAPGALPVIDAKRREVFTLLDGEPRVLAPQELPLEAGRVCVGDGATRYRALLEERGAVVPPEDDERHLPRARFHVTLAGEARPVDELEPLYLRAPDADRNTP